MNLLNEWKVWWGVTLASGLRVHRRGRGIEEQRGMKPVLLKKEKKSLLVIFTFRDNEQFLLIKINITFKKWEESDEGREEERRGKKRKGTIVSHLIVQIMNVTLQDKWMKTSWMACKWAFITWNTSSSDSILQL